MVPRKTSERLFPGKTGRRGSRRCLGPSRGIEALESRILLTVTYAPLYSFLGEADGSSPNAVVVDANGNVYGSTLVVGVDGQDTVYTVFEIPAGQTTPTTLLSLNGANGVDASPSLVVDANGNVFGTTPTGGDYLNGSIFEIAATTHTVTPTFIFPTSGPDPNPTITIDENGNLFGTTTTGGANSLGQVFEITHPGQANQTFSQVYAFTSSDGMPGRIVVDPSDSILTPDRYYVTTSTNGSNGSGQVLQIIGSSSVPVDSLPANAGVTTLTVDSDHNLFGTTLTGGTHNAGTLFMINGGTRAFSTLYNFSNGTDGSNPNPNIVVDGSDNLYGSTSVGGHGTIFELVAGQSNLTLLHAFNGNDGNAPTYGIVGDPAGTMYGITFNGGSHDEGAIFRLVQTPIPPATQLVFTSTAPADGPVGALGTITVSVEDANGTLVTTDNSTVTLKILTGANGAHLAGTLSVNAVGGVATFTDNSISKAGTYTLEASNGVLTSATSGNFTLSATAATHLAFIQQPPATAVAGTTLAPALMVAIEDKSKNIVSSGNSMVTIAISKGPPGSAFANGTLSVQAVNGVATFNDLVLDMAGGYTLLASDGVLKAGKSHKFTITPDEVTAHIVIVTAPAATALVGDKLTPLVVALKDQFNNLVKSKTKATVTITSSPAGGAIGEVASASLAKGMATFKSISLNTAGSYSLQVADADIVNGSNVPVAFSETITPGTTTLAAPKTASSYPVGSPISLRSTLKSNASSKVAYLGTATVLDSGNNVLGVLDVLTNGMIEGSLNGLLAGSYTVTLNYTDDPNHTDVTSATFTLIVV